MRHSTPYIYKTIQRKRQQRGFSMLEVLITIVIMAFGLLGISGLMVKGIDNSTGADLSSRATQAANQMIDAIRANRGNLGNYTVTFANTASDFTTTSVQDLDRNQWLTTLAVLPNGDGDITCVAATSICTINVRFSNCIGALNQAQLTACASVAGNIRILTFVSQI
jgi:type IV pilus assembly protein PilV